MPDLTKPWIEAIEFTRQFFWGKFNTMQVTIRPWDLALIKTLKKFMEKMAPQLTIGADDCDPVFTNRLSVFRTNCGEMNTTAIVNALIQWTEDPTFKNALADETWRDQLGYRSITAEMFLRRQGSDPLMPEACQQGRFCKPTDELPLVNGLTAFHHAGWSDLNIAQLGLAVMMLTTLIAACVNDSGYRHQGPFQTLAILAFVTAFAGCLLSLLGGMQPMLEEPSCGGPTLSM